MLKCNQCGLEKTLECFPTRIGRSNQVCKKCIATQRHMHYLRNKERVLRRVSSYRAKNKELIQVKDKTYRVKNKNKLKMRRKELTTMHKENRLLWSASKRAKKKNIEFTITIDDIIIPEICPVLGIQLARDNSTQLDNSPTLDRIDSTKGYVKGNVCVISHKANQIKSNGTICDHLKIIEYMRSKGLY